ncbi:MAG: hypothetical protein ABWK00_03570 [Desulfurococcaceae archaeon]
MTEEVVFVRRASGLVRELEWYDVMLWALSASAGSGLTYYAVTILGDLSCYGGSLVLAFFLAGLLFLPLVIACAFVAQLASEGKISSEAEGTIAGRVDRLLKIVDARPKTKNWISRSKVGTRKPWYREVEELVR